MFIQIIKISKEGLMSLFYDIDGNKRGKIKIFILFIIIPFILSLFSLKLDQVDKIIDTLLTSLSIFITFIFTALFIVPDKLSSRIDMLKGKDDDATRNYLIRFYNFTKSFVQQMSFIIIQSLALIISLVVQKLYPCKMLTFINSVLLIVLILYLLTILSNMYILLMDDLHRNRNEMK